ncbi:MAG: HAD family hydrolase [Cyanobacteria bacterium Co-bin8]|nr:HAD family hydrolase [Cyanobacteria bacterium Co-bin8]
MSDSALEPSQSPRVFTQASEAAPTGVTSSATLFCDFDGPIVDVSDRYYATYRMGLEHIQAVSQKQVPIQVRYLSKVQFWAFKQNRVPDRQIALWSGLEGSQINDFLSYVAQIVNQPTLLHQDRLQPGVRQSLKLLRCHGIRVVLVTLRAPEQVVEFLQQHHLDWAFSGLYGMSQLDAAYTNQANHKIQRLRDAIADQHHHGYSTQTSWMIGDTEADIMAGQSAGLPTAALTCGIRSSNYLKAFRPTLLLPDLWSTAQHITSQVALRV